VWGGGRRPSSHEYVNDGVKVYCLPDEQWFASKIYDFGVIFRWGIFMNVFLGIFLGFLLHENHHDLNSVHTSVR